MINKMKKFLKEFKNYRKPILFFFNVAVVSISFILVYFTVPKFFDFNKRQNLIIKIIEDNFFLEIRNISDISYSIFPTPRLNIKNINLKFQKNEFNAKSKNLSLLLHPFHIYDYKKLDFKKIMINQSIFSVETGNFKKFVKYFYDLNNQIFIKNSKILLKDSKNEFLSFNKINFDNKNKKKLSFNGLLFEKRILINFFTFINENQLIIDLPDMGVKIGFFLDKKSSFDNYEGVLKSKILNTVLQFDFKKKENFEIYNSILRNKLFNTSIDGTIKTIPHFNFDLNLNIKKINFNQLKKLFNSYTSNDFDELTTFSKRINGKSKISYKGRIFKLKSFKKTDINLVLENGDLKFENSLLELDSGNVTFSGIVKENFGRRTFDFDLSLNFKDKTKILKEFKVKNNNRLSKEPINIDVIGTLNLSSRKIYFKKIIIDKINESKEEELLFYKEIFEKELINENLTGIFNFSKIKDFLEKIY